MAKNQNNNVAPATQKTEPEAKKDALATALAQIEKQFGKGAVMKLGDNASMQVDAISTGSLGLDLALGVGGVPRGRIIEVYGPESSGKTTLALHILAEAQKKGGEVAFIDVEHALDPTYAEALGVDINNLLVSQPDTGEQAMEICEALVRSGAIDAIVVDSVAAMVPRAEIEGEMGDSHVGLQARLMSQAMRKLTSVIGKTNTVCVFINQLREKVGVMYGNPEVTTGGRALKYYASVRIDIRRVEGLKDSSGQFIGNHTRAKIVKNKVAPPFREAEFDIMFGEGISKMSELIDVGVKLGIVQKSGAWFNYGDIRLGQGRDNAKQFLRTIPRSQTTSRARSAPMPISCTHPAARQARALRPRPRNPPRLQMPRSRWSRLLPAAARASWISWWRTKCPFREEAIRWPKKKSPPTPPRHAPGPWSFWPGRSFPPGSSMSAWGGSLPSPPPPLWWRRWWSGSMWTTSATPGPGRTACWPPARAAALPRRICGRRGWTRSRSLLRWKRPTPRTKRAETRSWKPPPPSWKDGTAASWPQGGKTLWWLRWPGGGLHIRLLKKRFGEWKRTVSSLLRAKRKPEKRRFAADFKFLLMAKVI